MTVTAQAVLEKLRSRGDGDLRFDSKDFARWAGDDSGEQAAFFNAMGLEIAREYDQGRLTYEFCDKLVNDLCGWVIDIQVKDPEAHWPDDFYEVYSAFDSGEYHRKADKSDDPVSEHTDPQIKAVLARHP